MPFVETAESRLYFEAHGSGFPILLLAPGGMRSSIEVWQRAPWHPVRELSQSFRVIAMDQRNAGRSRAPVTAADGWHSYAADQLALLDHLGITRCHLIGGCIGGAFCLRLMQAAPERVASAVLQQPIGYSPDNRGVFYELFDSWAEQLPSEAASAADPAALAAFRERMYGGEFVFSVGRDFVRSCHSPMLVLMGNDIYHPSAISREITSLAPHAELVERWKEPDAVAKAVQRVREFLTAHTPSGHQA